MLSLPPTVRIFLAPGATDMRKQFDGLAGLTRSLLAEDPLSGHLFVFCNRGRNRLKILYFDGTGFWLVAKRLEEGTFAWPDNAPSNGRSIPMTASELTLLLGGIDLRDAKRRRWWRRNECAEKNRALSAIPS